MEKNLKNQFDSLPPVRKRLAEAMVEPIRTAMKKGRMGVCIDCGTSLHGVLVHSEEECLIYLIMGS